MKVVTLARKPVAGSVAECAIEFGCGALNIDACRVGTEKVNTHSRGKTTAFPKRPGEKAVEDGGRTKRQDILDHSFRTGRWPSNLILQGDAVLADVDEQSGLSPSNARANKAHRPTTNIVSSPYGESPPDTGHADSGGASRFFFQVTGK